ncbi:DNA-processing protein DprA [Geminicoccaceae bacterium 1502E]|nr:DNA-processing protein DprA [Geminicoccaceae bacterium 1502E]
MVELDAAERLARLRLARSPGIGPKKYLALLRRFDSARAAVRALPRLIAGGHWPGVSLAPEEAVERELAAVEAAGAVLLLLGEPAYPRPLAAIADPPPALLVRGRTELLLRDAVAIVGARNASGNGRVLAGRMARELAGAGATVVSGLARGIDAAAHEAALDQEGGTMAVVAGGFDVVYPQENAALMERIAADGCILAERPPGAVPRAGDFPRRNRLIAGLCLGVVVVEAAPRSGSLITARLAAEQGREVMAVPGSPLDPRHRGTNQLLRDGAQLVESGADVLEVLAPMVRRPASVAPSAMPRRPSREPLAAAPAPTGLAAEGLDADLLARLGSEPVSVDELIRQCHASTAAVQEALAELELAGALERHPGNRVALRAR